MANVKLHIPVDAYARQQMLAEMHRRKRVSMNSADQRPNIQTARSENEARFAPTFSQIKLAVGR